MTLIDKAEARDDDLIRRGDVLRILIGTANIERGPSTDKQRMIRALPARGVGVRHLAWAKDGKAWSAKTSFGEYRVAKVHGDWMWFFAWLPESNTDKIDKGYCKSEAAAKAAAQADYEARILAALAPTDAAQAREAAMLGGGDEPPF